MLRVEFEPEYKNESPKLKTTLEIVQEIAKQVSNPEDKTSNELLRNIVAAYIMPEKNIYYTTSFHSESKRLNNLLTRLFCRYENRDKDDFKELLNYVYNPSNKDFKELFIDVREVKMPKSKEESKKNIEQLAQAVQNLKKNKSISSEDVSALLYDISFNNGKKIKTDLKDVQNIKELVKNNEYLKPVLDKICINDVSLRDKYSGLMFDDISKNAVSKLKTL